MMNDCRTRRQTVSEGRDDTVPDSLISKYDIITWNITHIMGTTQLFALCLNIEPKSRLMCFTKGREGLYGNSEGRENWRATNISMIDEVFVGEEMMLLSVKRCNAPRFSTSEYVSYQYIATYQRRRQARYRRSSLTMAVTKAQCRLRGHCPRSRERYSRYASTNRGICVVQLSVWASMRSRRSRRSTGRLPLGLELEV